jgi:Domain of Unknown Function (DUF1080)
MRYLIFFATLTLLHAQQPPASAGDDVRGYNDTPLITGQKWKVHDMERPRPVKVAPGAPMTGVPPSDAIVLFDGKDLSQWVTQGKNGAPVAPTWKVEKGYIEIVPRTGKLVTKQSFGDCQLHVEGWSRRPIPGKGRGWVTAALS